MKPNFAKVDLEGNIKWVDAPEWVNSIATCDYDDYITNHFKGRVYWMAATKEGRGTPGYFINYKLRPLLK